MAKAPKRTTIADSKPLQSTPNDWMPLTDAFQHIQQVVGGEQLAEEDLRLRLESGDVEAQERRVTPGEGIDIIPLTPEDFKDGLLFPRLPKLDGDINFLSCSARRIAATTCCAALIGTAQMATISSCAALTCTAIWPIVGDSREAAGEQPALPTTRPKGIGHQSVARRAARCDALMREGASEWLDLDDLLKRFASASAQDEQG